MAYNEKYFVLPCMGVAAILVKLLNNLMNTPSNSPVISEKKMLS